MDKVIKARLKLLKDLVDKETLVGCEEALKQTLLESLKKPIVREKENERKIRKTPRRA